MDPNAVILIALALTLFIAELKIATHGVLTALGMVALAIGATLLIAHGDVGFGAGPWIVAGTVILLGVLAIFWALKVAASRHLPLYPGLGQEEGLPGFARSDIDPEGEVFVDGALWSAVSRREAIPAGSPIIVVGQRGLMLEVEPAALAAAGKKEA